MMLNRVSLNTIGLNRIGLNRIGKPSRGSSDRPYIDPEVLASLKAVCICYGKSNDDPDRAIVKNLVDPDNPFVISNAAFKLNSGFGLYAADFLDWTSSKDVQKTSFEVKITSSNYKENWVAYKAPNTTFKAMKVRISGIPDGGALQFFRTTADGGGIKMVNGINEIPAFTNTVAAGFYIDIPLGFDWSNLVIEQIPSFEGAFVTDGIDDLITSTKTVQEMLGGSNEITVVSMIHQIDTNANNFITTNNLRNADRVIGRNIVSKIGKTGIYGWYKKDIQGTTATLISDILGDKNDYEGHYTERTNPITNSKFYVTGYAVPNGFAEISSVAWYWTIIANKVLTTDQINQVIAYFNLDRTLKSDIYCNIAKQGITNENHAEFGDKLIDFSGNGRDIQLNNLAWDGDSGIGKYNYPNWKVNVTQGNKYARIVYYDSINGTYSANFKGITDLYKSYDLSIEIRVNRANTIDFHSIKEDGIYTITPPDDTTSMDIRFGGEDVYNASCNITITQIPSHAGALCLDGVNDFGQFVGDLELKDYTFIADRAYSRIAPSQVPFIASTQTNGQAPFLMEYLNEDTYVYPHSFGTTTKTTNLNIQRQISYQSTYVYNGNSISKGTSVDTGDGLTIGNSGSTGLQYSPLCLWSLMLFPYSMSEFLIERQLKKHKLGTLYPDMVEFRPVITINGESGDISYANDKWENINIGDYINIGEIVHILLYRKDIEEISNVKVNGAKFQSIDFDSIYNHWNINIELTSKSPQKIDITIDEYIRYEDIVQPYPVLLRFNDENGNEVSWGGKFRVGSTITRIGNIADPESNLLNGLYSISGLSLNGKAVTSSTSIVEKQMVFKTTATYLLDNNEPKVILSPRLLRIPNSSYKILGHIPDISGHGNHGKINNSAYAEGSGVNEDGSYQFDGVDDFITIPTLFSGGKQVLMKVNWDKTIADAILYDQRGYPNEFAIYNADVDNYNNPVFAYQARNNGQTYIDGILNKNIKASELRAITHNITITNELSSGANKTYPIIGSSKSNAYFVNMALYDFMLFDEISTDDKIKELNEYVGIEAKVELPPYYWDAYGKTNLDGDKATIQQRGVAEGDYDITNYNHAYDKISGYGGYNLGRFDKSWTSSSSSNTSIKVVQRNPYDITLKKLGGNSDWEFNNTELKVISNPVSVKFKSNKNIRVTCDYHYYPVGGNSEGTPLGITSKDLIANKDAIITISPISQENIDKYNIDVNRGYYLIYFQLSSTLAVNEEVTIEMLPLYPNGIVYDGVTDYSENANIPALTDYTYIFKREFLSKTTGSASMYKGEFFANGGMAFIADYAISDGSLYGFSYRGQAKVNSLNTDKIIYGTKTSVNGSSITPNTNIDTAGLTMGKFDSYRKMVFYKLILYPKTIPLLQINFLKNLMEKDEIIDLTNPIFIQE